MIELLNYYNLIANNYVETLAVSFCRMADTFPRSEIVDDFDRENESYTILNQDPVTGELEPITLRFIDELYTCLVSYRTKFLEDIMGMSTYRKNQLLPEVEELLTTLASKPFRDDYKKTISDHLFLIKFDLGSHKQKSKKEALTSFGYSKDSKQLLEALQNLYDNGVEIVKDYEKLDYLVKIFTAPSLYEYTKPNSSQKIQLGCQTKIFADFVDCFSTHFDNNLRDVIEQSKIFLTKSKRNSKGTIVKKTMLSSSLSNKDHSKSVSSSKAIAKKSKYHLEIMAAQRIIK